MDANLLWGAATLAAAGFGIWGLVFSRKNGNRNYEPKPPAPTISVASELAFQAAAHEMKRVADVVTELMEQTRNPPAPEPEIPPEWAARLCGDLEHINDRLSEPAALPPELEHSLNRLTDRLEAFMELPPPPPPEIPRVNDLITGIEALVNAERKRQARSAFRPVLPEKDPVETPPQELVPAPPSQPPERIERQPGPLPRHHAHPVHLEEYNMVDIPQDTIVEMIPPELDVFAVNVMNLGPGTVYLRADDEPVIDDPHATKLPPGTGDNGMRMLARLYALADVGGAEISVRLAL